MSDVKRYVPLLHVDHYTGCGSAEMGPADVSVQETHYVLASDHDATVARLSAEVAELRADRQHINARSTAMYSELERALAERDALRQRLDISRREVQDAAELLMTVNKHFHQRDPMAVTAIDEWLASRALASPTQGEG